MPATIAGCIVGFSEDIQRHIPEPCAKCKTNHKVTWRPWPGLWLCQSCFVTTSTPGFDKIIERLEVVKNGES